MKKLFPLLALMLLLTACGPKPTENLSDSDLELYEDIGTDYEVDERYDPNEPYFDGYGSEEEFAMVDKILATEPILTIDGKELTIPFIRDDFVNTLEITSSRILPYEEIGDEYFIDSTGNEYRVYYYYDGKTIENLNFEKVAGDITMPFGVKPGDSIETAREKIDPDFITDKEEIDSFITLLCHYTELAYSFDFDGILTNLYYRTDYEDSDIGTHVTTKYFSKWASESDESGTISLEGKTFDFPITLGELQNTVGGEYVNFTEELLPEFNPLNFEPEEWIFDDALVLKAGNNLYMVEALDPIPDNIAEIDPNVEVHFIYFKDTADYVLRNDTFEITPKNIAQFTDILDQNKHYWRSDHSIGDEVKALFFLDDNIEGEYYLNYIRLYSSSKPNRDMMEALWKSFDRKDDINYVPPAQ